MIKPSRAQTTRQEIKIPVIYLKNNSMSIQTILLEILYLIISLGIWGLILRDLWEVPEIFILRRIESRYLVREKPQYSKSL